MCQQTAKNDPDAGGKSPGAERSRRDWLAEIGKQAGWGGAIVLAASGGLWTAAIGRFLAPNTPRNAARGLKIGPAEAIPPGQVDTRFRDRHGVFVVRMPVGGADQIVALRAQCTHLGCITQWNAAENRFQCPCHGSAFRMDGTNIEGPAARPLERCAIRLAEDGQLEVDRAEVFRRELGQWHDPRCFVRVSDAARA